MKIEKIIFGLDLIDPIRLQVDGVKKLEVYHVGKDGSDTLFKTFKFNELGKVVTCQKPPAGVWTAYQPLFSPEETKRREEEWKEKSKQKIVDKYFYSPLGNLTKIETHNISLDKIILIQHLAYENNKIVSILSDKKKTEIGRDKNGRILSIHQTYDIILGISQTMGYIIKRNNENRIIGRDWELITTQKKDITPKEEGIIAKEKFHYNEFNQLTKSEITSQDEHSKDHAHNIYKYLNEKSDLAISQELFENNELTGTMLYQYDNKQRIVKQLVRQKTLNFKKVVTKYQWS